MALETSDEEIFQKMLIGQAKDRLEILQIKCIMWGCHSYFGPNCDRCGKLLKENEK